MSDDRGLAALTLALRKAAAPKAVSEDGMVALRSIDEMSAAILGERGVFLPDGLPQPPYRTRLAIVADDILSIWGTRTEDGCALTAEWGEPDANGWYVPIFTAHQPAVIREQWAEIAHLSWAIERFLTVDVRATKTARAILHGALRAALSVEP